MANHGAITWGADLAGALAATEVLEWACAVYWRAAQIGTPRVMDDAARDGVHDRADAARLREEGDTVKAVAMGVHVLDVLVRPVESIPEGQGGALVEQIKVTAAGSAGGAALVLAKLGAEVRSAGAIGTDAAGRHAARAAGSATASTRRCCCAATTSRRSASVLPIRPGRLAPRVPRRRRERDLRARRRRLGRDRRRDAPAPRRPGVHGRRGRGEDPRRRRASAGHHHVGRHPRAGRQRDRRLDRARVRAPRLPAAQRRAGARLQRRGRPRRRAPAR